MVKYKILFVVIIIVSLFPPALLYSQVNTAWVRNYNGSCNMHDEARAIAVDNFGNVYVSGYAHILNTGEDFVTIKYNANGDTLWIRTYSGNALTSDDRLSAMAIDDSGNIYITGYSSNLGTGHDYATVKYLPNGNIAWVRIYDGFNRTDEPSAIVVDQAHNVYVTGLSTDAAGLYSDYLTIKYDATGTVQWTARYNGAANSYDEARAIAVDPSGNVYVTGMSHGNNYYYDFTTIKYNAQGVQQWVQRYSSVGNYNDIANAIAVDNNGNVYVTGWSYVATQTYDFTTIKYNTNGDTLWVRKYGGAGNDYAYKIALDNLCNVYVFGVSYGANADYLTIKYNSNGVQQWVKRYNNVSDDYAYAMVLDNNNNVYVTGSSLGSGTGGDFATVKYNSDGVQQWVVRYNNPANTYDVARAIAVDNQGNVYVAGNSESATTDDDYTTIKYIVTGAIEEERLTLDALRSMLKIYPNPTKSVFYVRAPFSVNKVTIYDVSGKIVKEVRGKRQEARISTDDIKNGVYFVRVNDELVKEKLVITK